MRLSSVIHLSIGTGFLFSAALFSNPAQAITYTFTGDLSGDFTYNPPSTTLSSVNLTYQGGTYPNHTFTTGSGNGTTFQFGPTGSNTPFMTLNLSSGSYTGSYCPEERGSSGACRFGLDQVTGQYTITEVPSLLAPLSLLPFVLLTTLRKRYRSPAQVLA
jgi:hypothetical protein